MNRAEGTSQTQKIMDGSPAEIQDKTGEFQGMGKLELGISEIGAWGKSVEVETWTTRKKIYPKNPATKERKSKEFPKNRELPFLSVPHWNSGSGMLNIPTGYSWKSLELFPFPWVKPWGDQGEMSLNPPRNSQSFGSCWISDPWSRPGKWEKWGSSQTPNWVGMGINWFDDNY